MPSPMPIEVADQVLAEIHQPRAWAPLAPPARHGAGQCLHWPPPSAGGCARGYHGGCSGWSWPELHETWIRDSGGSDLFWG
ncbi:hypothetical protein [Nocardiopsis sp. YSL2]|uniref:hypothetical protein n=1 Tax=Nocardiopsis sp. YSL2 TaxID=2939492 RepID=UPI0026F42211|nr:hypothetical protein [Nocardiopsis sp. YSL2]